MYFLKATENSLFYFLILIFGGIFVFSAVYLISNSLNKSSPKKKKRQKVNKKKISPGVIAEFLPNFDRQRFNRDVFSTFVYVQQASNNYNIEILKSKLGPELFQNYNKRIAFNRSQGRTLIRNEFTHFYTDIIGITRRNGEIIANVLLGVEFKEYFLDSSNQIMGGDIYKPRTREFNILMLVKNNNRAIISCPHCGALVGDRVNPKCKYCEKPIISYDYDLMMLKERSRNIQKPKFYRG